MSERIEKRHFTYVSASGSSQLDYVIPNGKKLVIFEFGGEASSSPETACCIGWDPAGAQECLYSTHSAGVSTCRVELTGDGSKILRINLENNLEESDHLGAWWKGILHDG